MKRLKLVAVCLLSLLIWPTNHDHATGCAAVPREGFRVSIRDEFAFIVWDPTTKIEHFTRVARFDTDAPDLGFLVPTPSVPTIVEVNGGWLDHILNLQTRARVRSEINYVTRYGLGPWPFGRVGPTAGATPDGAGVEVLRQYEVAGYVASVLRGEDAGAIKTWLDDNEYPTSNSLEDWLGIYTDQRWIITAFKLSKGGESDRLTSRAVRMSFKTERPFYPYREPITDTTSANSSSRKLRVFLLSDAKYHGRIGTNGSWPARTVWSGPMLEHLRKNLHGAIKSNEALPNWLTEFVDNSSPRRGIDDLYFHKTDSQETIERPVEIRTVSIDRFVPGWKRVIVVTMTATPLILGGAVFCWRRRRRKSDHPKSK